MASLNHAFLNEGEESVT